MPKSVKKCIFENPNKTKWSIPILLILSMDVLFYGKPKNVIKILRFLGKAYLGLNN